MQGRRQEGCQQSPDTLLFIELLILWLVGQCLGDRRTAQHALIMIGNLGEFTDLDPIWKMSMMPRCYGERDTKEMTQCW